MTATCVIDVLLCATNVLLFGLSGFPEAVIGRHFTLPGLPASLPAQVIPVFPQHGVDQTLALVIVGIASSDALFAPALSAVDKVVPVACLGCLHGRRYHTSQKYHAVLLFEHSVAAIAADAVVVVP